MEWDSINSIPSFLLTGLSRSGVTTSYEYDINGRRTKKVANGVTTEYYYSGEQYTGMHTSDGKDVGAILDASGGLYGIYYDDSTIGTDVGQTYYFVYNGQGDVIGLYNHGGKLIATYAYDAWGRCIEAKAVTADDDGHAVTDPDHIAFINPFRYRGYMYDAESGLYYVGNRYYDPEVGRWINADSVMPEPGNENALIGSNMFAYCMNNPVNMEDQSGHWPKWLKAVAVAVAAVAVVAVVAAATVASGGSAVPVIVGAAVGAASSGAVDAAIQYKNTGKVDICQTIVAASGGAVTGAVGGSGAGRVVQTVVGAATGAAQTKAKEVVTGKKASAAEYIVNTAAGGLAGIAAGSGAQHINQAPTPKITHYLSQPNFALFDKSLATRAALGSIARGIIPGLVTDMAFSESGDRLISLFE